RDLTDRGVPASSIVLFRHRADNTLEEAQALRSLVVDRRWRRLIVVTSNYHTRRARYIFSRVMPSDVEVEMAAAPDPAFVPDHWWETRIGLKTFSRELAGMCIAMWELRAGSEAKGSLLGVRLILPGRLPRAQMFVTQVVTNP
ncbi:MAG: YdcF family protein, partial [Bryobacteraceae bacterium]